MKDLQSALGYSFRSEKLLSEALTTPSCRMDDPDTPDNQRLEFLGDAVLGFIAAERLFGEFPDEQEGRLTIRRSQMVSSVALCCAADRIGLVEHLRRNRRATPLPKGAKTLADAVEALIGAAYVDGGIEAARKVFDSLGLAAGAANAKWGGNPKGELQVRAQSLKPPQHPCYELLDTAGKAHEPVFTVRVSVDGIGEATASAHSHKEAEAIAAAKLLSSFAG